MTIDNKAADLVHGAKQWASQYGDFAHGSEGAVLTAVLRCRAAWDSGDARAFTDMFIDDAWMLVGDQQLADRDAIHDYLSTAFAGALAGTRLVEAPLDIRLITPDVAIAVTEGGIVRAEHDSPDSSDLVRSTWVAVRRGGDWRIASHQTSPVHN